MKYSFELENFIGIQIRCLYKQSSKKWLVINKTECVNNVKKSVQQL